MHVAYAETVDYGARLDEMFRRELPWFYGEEWKGICEAVMGSPFMFFIALGAIIGTLKILAAHIRAVHLCRSVRKPIGGSNLTYSYTRGTGQYRRGKIYEEARRIVKEKEWFKLSFSYLALYIDKHSNTGKGFHDGMMAILEFFVLLLAYPEKWFVGIFAPIYYTLAELVHAILLSVLNLISFIIYLIVLPIDKLLCHEWHCNECYMTFARPVYKCDCGKVHKDLAPSRAGTFYATCLCGRKLPVASVLQDMQPYCPECDAPLGKRELRAADCFPVIGTESSHKTGFIASFAHIYSDRGGAFKWQYRHDTTPDDFFEKLESAYKSGKVPVSPSNHADIYTFRDYDKETELCMSSFEIIDMPVNAMLGGEAYDKNQVFLRRTKGVVLVVDPLDSQRLRDRCNLGHGNATTMGSADVVSSFASLWSSVSSKKRSTMVEAPIAVAVGNAHIRQIASEIGDDAVRTAFEADPARFDYSLEEARSQLCREFLDKWGFGELLNEIDANFSKVRFFPFSLTNEVSNGYAPSGVATPMAWLFSESKNMIHAASAESADNMMRGYGSCDNPKQLKRRFASASRLLGSREYDKAEAAYRELGKYMDADSIVSEIPDLRYAYAKEQMDAGNFKAAIQHFEAIADHRDSASLLMEARYRYADECMENGGYQEAANIYHSLGTYRMSKTLVKKALYQNAGKLAKQGKTEQALAIYQSLGDYEDSSERASALAREAISSMHR